MTGKTHQVIGLTAGLAVYIALNRPEYAPGTLAATVVVSSIGALLPDIDSPAGRIWGMIPFGHVWSYAVDPFLQHRNLTHSILGYLLVLWGWGTILHHVPSYWGLHRLSLFISFAVAYASHILADMVTVEGVPLFFPYQRMFGIPPHPFQGLRIITGHWFENLIIFPIVNIALIFCAWHYWPYWHAVLFH